ncbi:MAG: hypothetical protein [Wigfec virus K19_165]|nr:MAG: hypothetical protein [Wigfec virus K19_165]
MLVTEVLINTWNRRRKPTYEKVLTKSETVPNQSMSIRQILDKFARGQEVGGHKEPSYSEEDYSDLDKMDRFEKLDLARDLRQQIKVERQKLAETPPTPLKVEEKPAAPSVHEGAAG